MKKQYIKPSNPCPQCGKNLSGVSMLNREDIPKPNPGDLSVCLYCGALLKFDDELNCQNLTDIEISQLSLQELSELNMAKQFILEKISRENSNRNQ